MKTRKRIIIRIIAMICLVALMVVPQTSLGRYVGTFVGNASLSLFKNFYIYNDRVVSITAKTISDTYSRGDTPEYIVTANLADGTTKIIESGYTVSSVNMSVVGNKNPTITYVSPNGTTFTATVSFRVAGVSAVSITPKQNIFNINEELTYDKFTVFISYDNGTSRQVGTTDDDFTINSVDMSTKGTKTVTFSYNDSGTVVSGNCSIKVQNINILQINYERYDGKYHRMWWFGENLANVSGWFNYVAYIGQGTLDSSNVAEAIPGNPPLAKGEKITVTASGTWGTMNNPELGGGIHRQDSDAPQGLEFLAAPPTDWYSLRIDDALPSTTIGVNCSVGYDAAVLGIGCYIGDDPTTLQYVPYTDPAVNNWQDNVWGYGHQTISSFPLSSFDMKSGESYVVHWVAVFDNGLQRISDWEINMKEADANDKYFIDDKSKPNVNVIIMAGQSNMFGASPITNDLRNDSLTFDPGNVYINYKNINFAGENNPNLVTLFTNLDLQKGIRFEKYTLGRGGQADTHFGPEYALAKYLATTEANNLNGETWYIIKYAAAGTALTAQWTNGCVLDGNLIKSLTDDMLAYVKEQIAYLESLNYDVQIRSFMWMQGESDAIAESTSLSYASAERTLINKVRDEFAEYATRPIGNIVGSGISFISAGIADNYTGLLSSQGGPNDWIFAENVNQGKISNTEWWCCFSTETQNPPYTPSSGPLQGNYFKFINDKGEDEYRATIANPDAGSAIVNSVYIDTYYFLSKYAISNLPELPNEVSQYSAGDRTDKAHYSTTSMKDLGGLFGSCMHYMITKNG